MTTHAASLNPVLQKKFRSAAKAILDSRAVLVCSGSGMTADCRLSTKSQFANKEDFRIMTNGVNVNDIVRNEE